VKSHAEWGVRYPSGRTLGPWRHARSTAAAELAFAREQATRGDEDRAVFGGAQLITRTHTITDWENAT
jgi:hypothetical protein